MTCFFLWSTDAHVVQQSWPLVRQLPDGQQLLSVLFLMRGSGLPYIVSSDAPGTFFPVLRSSDCGI